MQKYKKNEKNKEKITKHPCARINKLEYKALWNPQGLLDAVMLCERAPEQIEIVGKAVQPHQHDGIRAVFFIGTQRGTLGTPADLTSHVAHRNDGVATRDREFVDRFERVLHRVDTAFEPGDGLGSQRRNLPAPRFSACQQCLDGHQA